MLSKNIKNQIDVDQGFKDNLTLNKEIHDKIKELGFEYIIDKLRKYGFSNPEKLAKEILSKDPTTTPKTRKEQKIDDLRKQILEKFSNI